MQGLRRHFKIAVRRHLGFYRTGNSAIRSADPGNPCLESKHGVDRMHRLRDIRLSTVACKNTVILAGATFC